MSETPFQLQIEGRAPVPLNEVILTRGLGDPAIWRFIVDAKSAGWTDNDESWITHCLWAGPVHVKAVWEPEGFNICDSATIRSLTRKGPTGWDLVEWRGY